MQTLIQHTAVAYRNQPEVELSDVTATAAVAIQIDEVLPRAITAPTSQAKALSRDDANGASGH